MLCLSRKVGEKIYVGEDVVITVLEITRGNVRLDINAPRNVLVLRGELRKVDDVEEFETRVARLSDKWDQIRANCRGDAEIREAVISAMVLDGCKREDAEEWVDRE